MANTIKLKRGSGSDPSASDLVLGEIAVRTDNGTLFTKKDDGSVAEISGSGGSAVSYSINTLSSSSATGGGSASFNGSAYRFTLSNAPLQAAQLLVSIEGVIQKPNSGSSQPSEGFAINGDDIIFAAAPANGASFFIVSTVVSASLVTPADNTVTSAKILDGSILNADINASAAIDVSKLSGVLPLAGGTLTGHLNFGNSDYARFGASNQLQIGFDGSNSLLAYGTGTLFATGSTFRVVNNGVSENIIWAKADAEVELYYNNSQKFETSNTGITVFGAIAVSGTVDGRDVAADGTKLDGIEASATADQTAAEIRALVESASNSNVFTDADHTKLNGIEASATADQSNSEIKTAYEANSDTNAFTDALLSKLNGIAASATNVTNNNQLTNGAGYITSASLVGANNGGNAALLDGIDSTQFVRSDASDTLSGQYTFSSSADEKIVLEGSNDPYIRFREGTTNKAYLQWNDDGHIYLWNNEVNKGLRLGSQPQFYDGSYQTIWHSNNDGASSGLDADLLDGQQGSYYLDYGNLTNVPSVSSFASGTKAFFGQTSAPTGWTKVTSNTDNRALRLVSGTAGSGGSNSFTTAFNSSRGTSGGSVSNHTLTESQIPSHRHRVDTYNEFGNQFGNWTTQGGYRQAHAGGTRRPPWSDYTGGGSSHNHGFSNPSLNLNVQYVDVIMCSKD